MLIAYSFPTREFWCICGREPVTRALIHALDGNGTIKTHRGPLIDAIESSRTGTGEVLKVRNAALRFRMPAGFAGMPRMSLARRAET
jgi:hypothetical protein